MAQKRSDDTAAAPDAAPSASPRIDGVDAARAIAVFGMFAVHLGVESMGLLSPEGHAWTLHGLVRGNSSALFALLAGLSLALMTGRTAPVTGVPWRRAAVRVLTRAVLIGLLGVLLDLTGVPVAIILTYYAGFFVLALPLTRLRSGALWAVAGALAVVGPPLSFLLRDTVVDAAPRTSSLSSLPEFLLTGYYPAITFMAFVAAGLAVGRMDLRSTAVRLRLLGIGAGLSVFAYGGSWLLLHPLGGLDRLVEDGSAFMGGYPLTPNMDPVLLEQLRAGVMEEANSISGQVPTDSWWWLAVNTPHTGTTFEIAEAVGQGLLVLVACMWLAERARWAMYPLASVGRMPLTVYTGHILVLMVIVADGAVEWRQPWLLEWFVLGALVFATLWFLVLRRGPAEACLALAADGAVAIVEEWREERRPPNAP
ncbi:putative membrane protein YeiB [Nocardiopsis sp. Huas11]|uniref:heparan-alpha-glucosaminide N-acetyltransferase domain-containing protein n=1 Tax=Nocardiopsis sp. Huas11 TaxID=2183912 RepID=UPI000EB29D23|nr:heparan-alpha-glucosaminide N-acetyltransferase domain-containing protein [Nocardiopsis sp. Huas11]RKS04657.1 putative membrane protein YeiB [Nocardiopsis sp. Huas11]